MSSLGTDLKAILIQLTFPALLLISRWVSSENLKSDESIGSLYESTSSKLKFNKWSEQQLPL